MCNLVNAQFRIFCLPFGLREHRLRVFKSGFEENIQTLEGGSDRASEFTKYY
jgi:hypothetical protein